MPGGRAAGGGESGREGGNGQEGGWVVMAAAVRALADLLKDPGRGFGAILGPKEEVDEV